MVWTTGGEAGCSPAPGDTRPPAARPGCTRATTGGRGRRCGRRRTRWTGARQPGRAVTGPALPGEPFPLGATPGDGGTNFAVASRADAIQLCLFDEDGSETRVALPEYDAGIWHGFVRGVGPGQAYGYRASGLWDPGRGLRYNPAKLLLDPYARAVHGEVRF